MQPSQHDAPLVPESPATETETETPTAYADGGDRPERRRFDRPPRTDYAREETRHREEIEPGAADLR